MIEYLRSLFTRTTEGTQLIHISGGWRSFRQIMPGQQAARLAGSYHRVFRTASASDEDREMVLVDLATKSGFYRVTPKHGADIAYSAGVDDGKREMFGHIYNILRLSPRERGDLETATRTDWLMIANSSDQGLRSQY